MKKGSILSKLSILAILLVLSGSAFAQRGQRNQRVPADKARMAMKEGRTRIEAVLDLSDEQKEEMRSLRADHQKEMRYQHSLINEKNARLRTLMSAPEHDKDAIEMVIDDISGLKGELMKKQIANKEEMKSILSPEQLEKIESLGFGNGRRQGLRGNRGQDFRDGRRGGIAPQGRTGFYGRGLGRPIR